MGITTRGGDRFNRVDDLDRTRSSVANTFETRYTYFADGTIATQTQVQSHADIADEATSYQYDIFGNQALVVKPKLNQQVATYDVRNRLALVEDQLGHQTRFEYDANNNLLRRFQAAANNKSVPTKISEFCKT